MTIWAYDFVHDKLFSKFHETQLQTNFQTTT